MIDWLLSCSSDELRSVIKLEREFDATMEQYCCSRALTNKKGRIALVGIGNIGTSVVDKLYEKLLPIESMVDSFSFLESGGDFSLLLKEGEVIYKNNPLILVLMVTKIGRIDDTKDVLGVCGIAKHFLCDNFYAIPLMERTACGGSSTLFERFNVSPVFTEEVCQRAETSMLYGKVPMELSLLRLYTSALSRITVFLKKDVPTKKSGTLHCSSLFAI